MADNVVLPGTGQTVAADELTDGVLGSVKVQYVKLMDGGLGGTTKAAVGSAGLAVLASLNDDFHLDAFGRLRVSDANTRLDVEFSNDDQPLVMDKITAGGATIAHNATTRDVSLSIVGAGGTATATFGSHNSVPYTPGNSQLIDITGTMDYGNIGGGAAYFFLRNNGNDTEVAQADWLGAANVTSLDYTKSQILAIDFQSLKVGRLRLGFVRNGVPVFAHAFYNDNLRANGYWQRPNLPIAWKIYNNASNQTVADMGYFDANNGIGLRYVLPVNASAKLLAICATVKSEGGDDIGRMKGFPFAFGNGATTKTVANSLIPLCSLQVQTTFNSIVNRTLVVPTGVAFVTDQPIYYQIVLNPSLTNASFASLNANCSTFGDVAATALSGGTVIGAGYAGSGGTRSGGVAVGLTDRTLLSINYAGTVGDILTVAAIRATGTSAAAGAVFEFKEIR